MRLEPQTIRENIYQGSIQGAKVWTVYAIVECFFLSILPWIIEATHDYIPLHWGFTALLFGLYPALGLILGGLCGLCLGLLRGRRSSLQISQRTILLASVARMSFVFVFAASLIVQLIKQPILHLLPPLVISFLLTIALALSATSSIWFGRLLFLTNPWAMSVLLLGLPWMTHELFQSNSRIIQGLVALGYILLISTISFWLQKVVEKRRIGNSGAKLPSSRNLAPFFIILAALLVLGISFVLHRQHNLMARYSMPSTPGPNRSNVILITLDTVRADHLSLYGYERDTTPKLKEFSGGATLYTDAIAPGDMTLSTHASIFTGLSVRRHGAHWDPPQYPWGRPLANKFRTLSEVLSEKGYFTMGVVANHLYLSHRFGFARGFHYYDQRAPIPFLGAARFYTLRSLIRNCLTRFASPSDFDQLFRRAGDINREEVFPLLQKVRNQGTPFFLFVNYMDAHDPYAPPSPFDRMFAGKINYIERTRYNRICREVIKLERKVTEAEYRHLVSQYDGGIAYIDFHVGELIERLKKLGIYENCLIIITSDHGEAFGERDLMGHGVSVYQDQVHVPLMIKYPNKRQGAAVHETVSLCDLMPTILDVLGYDIPGNIDGESLLRLKQNGSREVISESFPNGYLINWHPRFRRVERAFYSRSFKFMNSTAGKRELYDLSKDPNEKQNLYNGNGGISQELETALNRWLSEVKEESGSPPQLDKATVDRLKSLGYIK